ncbi:MAG: peptide-methionine (R)-S-oxide reductase MsrB, partial [Wenzhouxiangellaceae bacterium]
NMKRRMLLTAAGISALALAVRAGAQSRPLDGQTEEEPGMSNPEMTLEDWQRILPAERYDILFREKTERAWSSPLNDEKRDGAYICAACYQPLFASADKFDSGTGWPSFTRPIRPDAIGTKRDFKLIWPRTEYHCSNCGGHQGHVFDDGPEPTGQRWCNNGLALEFVPEGETLPDLRA